MFRNIISFFFLIFSVLICYPLNSYAAGPCIFFSDLTDGPISGWEGSSTKGAAVSIWGYNLGEERDGGYVTVGGVNLTSDSDYAEWGATTNPTTARGLQRITFYLNSSMATGQTTIKVTTSVGESDTISFYTRDSGNIYFVSPTGSDSATGKTTSVPWLTAMKARGAVEAGDVVYFRGGTHTQRDTTSVSSSNYCYIHFYNGNHAAGTENNSITFAAYPAELPVFGDGTSSVPKFIRQVGYSPNVDHLDYWTFSKFKVQAYDSVLAMSTGSQSTADYIRFVGLDATTTAAATGTGVCFWFTGNLSNSDSKFYGNYVHHTGKALDWVESDGSGYRVGPIYFQGFGKHGTVDVGWNEFAYNNGQSQFYGHYYTDRITLLKYHDNYIHHTASAPQTRSGPSAVFGGGDDNSGTSTNYAYITDCYIYNNIFAFNGNDIRLSDHTSRGSYGGNIYYYNNTNYGNTTSSSREFNTGNFDSLVFKNNIIYTTAGSGNYFNEDSVTWKSNATGSNNRYYGLSNALESWDDSSTSTAGVDPKMMDPDNGDFTLMPDSTCIDSGATLSLVGYDTRGQSRPQYNQCDIGAYEYTVHAPSLAKSGSPTKSGDNYTFTFTWDAVSEASSYKIYSSSDKYSNFDSGQSISSGTSISLTVPSLYDGIFPTVFYKMKSFDSQGRSSDFSNIVSTFTARIE